jgi:predicted TIM-barrel fold metal-dependent hydrolase
MHELPSNACDCHVHVVGSPADYPMVADRHYTPGPAPISDLSAHLGRLGLGRTVIIQPSFYGTDNRCMIHALTKMNAQNDHVRGIAVVAPGATDSDLQALDLYGVRGLRLNLESSSNHDPKSIVSAIEVWAEKIKPLGWHIQIFAALSAIAQAAPQLAQLPVPVVFDHFALMTAGVQSADNRQAIDAVLHLIKTGKAYVKLSAPYRLQNRDVAAVLDLAHRLTNINPEQILWGSDWPHTARDDNKPAVAVSSFRAIDPSTLAQTINDWLPSTALKEKVLVTNPARLYGFN